MANTNTCMQWESAFCDEEAYEVVVTGSSNSGGGAYTSGGGASGQIDREEHTPQDREQEKQKCKQNNVVNNQLCKSNARDAFTSDMKECDYWMNTALAISGGSITGYRRIGIGPAGLAQAFAGVVAAKASTCQTSTAAKRDQFLQTCESIKLNNDSACDKL
ncbi:MAG: hypothetical protein EOP48_09905 [Sphingobacteriales bacterium]|nr:MAG: hypothetical protein EOP48_09905 [Sphingobacteriales bacterium]